MMLVDHLVHQEVLIAIIDKDQTSILAAHHFIDPVMFWDPRYYFRAYSLLSELGVWLDLAKNYLGE
jgi:hypothetical protein